MLDAAHMSAGLIPIQTILCLRLQKLGPDNQQVELTVDELKKLQYLMTQDLSGIQGVDLRYTYSQDHL